MTSIQLIDEEKKPISNTWDPLPVQTDTNPVLLCFLSFRRKGESDGRNGPERDPGPEAIQGGQT